MAHFVGTIAIRQITRLCNSDKTNQASEAFSLQQCIPILQSLLKELQTAYQIERTQIVSHIEKDETAKQSIPLCTEHMDSLQDKLEAFLRPDIDRHYVAELITHICHVGRSSLSGIQTLADYVKGGL